MVLLRALCGGWHRPELAGWDDRRLLEAVRAELRLTLGIEAAPAFVPIVRWPRALPPYHLGPPGRVGRLGQRSPNHPRAFPGGNWYRGVALNDCTKQGEILAKQVIGYLS